jgi:hypothetical protein
MRPDQTPRATIVAGVDGVAGSGDYPILDYDQCRAGRVNAMPAAYIAAVMRRPVGRWLVLLTWLWVGWRFFVR